MEARHVAAAYASVVRATVQELQRMLQRLDAVFVLPQNVPDDAPEADFELASDVDVLQATVVGGLRRTSVTTEAVLQGIDEAQALLTRFRANMTRAQVAIVEDLLSALRSA
jgi:hypothetical protein